MNSGTVTHASRRLSPRPTRSPAKCPYLIGVGSTLNQLHHVTDTRVILATGHLRYLETVKEQLEMRLKSAEAEVHRLRNVNEALMLSTARHAVAAGAPALTASPSF